MAWIKCRYCNKRISDKALICPRCNKKLGRNKIDTKRLLYNSLFIVAQLILCLLLYYFSFSLIFSDSISDLFIIFGICSIIYISVIFSCSYIFKTRKLDVFVVISGLVSIFSFVFSTGYLIKGISALRYNNSVELLKISSHFDIKEAKSIKTGLEGYFEYDSDNSFSRDIIINDFYCVDDIYSLYIDDIYNNYSLKFFVTMKDGKISDIFWNMDEYDFYLVKDGKKTGDFEYYYAMNIVNSVAGEEITGLSTIENEVEQKVEKELGDVSALLLTYEKLRYSPDKDMFFRDCEAESMDFSGNMANTKFLISFEQNGTKSNNDIWYYGDCSFEYVNWDVNI